MEDYVFVGRHGVGTSVEITKAADWDKPVLYAPVKHLPSILCRCKRRD